LAKEKYNRLTVVTTEAYNEQDNIEKVLSRMPEGYYVVLVDDGSTDRTVEVASRFENVKVVSHPVNLGQGVAFVTGLKIAIDEGFKYMVHLDSDGQHNPGDIPRFEKELMEGTAEVIVGSRVLGSRGKTTFLRHYFLPVVAKILNLITHYNMTDPMCGFRGYNLDSLRPILSIFDDYHSPQHNAVEMFIRFSRAGIKVKEIPVEAYERSSGTSYKGEIRYGYNVIMAILKTYLEGFK